MHDLISSSLPGLPLERSSVAFHPFPTLEGKKNLTKQILSLHELFSAKENALIRSHNGRPLKWRAILQPLIYISDLGRASVMQEGRKPWWGEPAAVGNELALDVGGDAPPLSGLEDSWALPLNMFTSINIDASTTNMIWQWNYLEKSHAVTYQNAFISFSGEHHRVALDWEVGKG